MTDTSGISIQGKDSENPFHDLGPGQGQNTQIHGYCQSKGEDTTCIWLCRRYGRTMFAQDMTPEFDEESLRLCLQKSSWLAGYVFYGNVGIRPIEVRD